MAFKEEGEINLNRLGKEIVFTTIDRVSKYDFDNCIKCILEKNPDVNFYNIKYYENSDKVCFYTDKEIDIKDYQKRFEKKMKPIKNFKNVLFDINAALKSDEDMEDRNIISLYDLHKAIDRTYRKFAEATKIENFDINVKDFDFDKRELKVNSHTHLYGCFSSSVLSKNEGDLYCTTTESNSEAIELLKTYGKELSKIYDKYPNYRDYCNMRKEMLLVMNTKFTVTVDFKRKRP